MAGRDYAYYQISFLDFPMNDSLTKNFNSSYIDLSVSVIMEWIAFPSLNVSSTRFLNTQVPLEVKRISSIKDLADKLWIALMNLTLPTAQSQAMYWKAFLAGVDYDIDSQKLVLALSPTTTWNDFPVPASGIDR